MWLAKQSTNKTARRKQRLSSSSNECLLFWYQRYDARHDKTYTAQSPANNSAGGHQDNVYSDASAKTEAVHNKNNSAVGHQVSVCYSDASTKYEAGTPQTDTNDAHVEVALRSTDHGIGLCKSIIKFKEQGTEYITDNNTEQRRKRNQCNGSPERIQALSNPNLQQSS